MLPNINAAPQNVNQLLSGNLFLIPEYQRPYSWGEDKCEVLWNDLYEHFASEPDDSYFLGSIILVEDKNEKDKKPRVIDGQQRLITLSILLRVFFNHDAGYKGLGRCLYQYDPRNEERKLGNRIESKVLGGAESESLDIILEKNTKKIESLAKNKSINNYARNYEFFEDQVSGVENEEKLHAFIDYVLENVYLLPIRSDNLDKALVIFETINTRGLELSAADIFKSKLYQLAGEKSETFIQRWDDLTASLSDEFSTKKLSIVDLFRWHMSKLRAENDDRGKPVALREFFEKGLYMDTSKNRKVKTEYKLDSRSWEYTMDSLELLKTTHEFLLSKDYPRIRNWYNVLCVYGKEAVLPAVLCVFKSLEPHPDNGGIWQIALGKEKYCEQFLRNVARYVYAKGFDATAGTHTVPDAMLQAAVNAMEGKVFLADDKNTDSIKITDSFLSRLNEHLTPKFRRGFCMILELINPNCKNLHLDGDIEHILPKQWDANWYDQWSDKKVEEVLNTLGNLVLFEKILNIKGGNSFFEYKKKQYGNSDFAEVRDLCVIDHWVYDDYRKRHESSKEKLCAFLRGEI